MRNAVLVLDAYTANQILSWADVTDAVTGLTPSEKRLRHRVARTLLP